MGGYCIIIWAPSKLSGNKREMIEAEAEELRRKTDICELGGAHWWSGEPVHELYSLLMFHKGLKYVPEVVDSMIFGVGEILSRLHLEWPPAPKYWRTIKDEMKNLYPHAAELMKKVDAGIKMIRGFDRSHFFCWPVEVVGLKEVMEEVEILLKRDLFSEDDPRDRSIFEKAIEDMGFSRDELEKRPLDQLIDEAIEHKNVRMKQWGEFFLGAYEIRRKYNVPLFFAAPFL